MVYISQATKGTFLNIIIACTVSISVEEIEIEDS